MMKEFATARRWMKRGHTLKADALAHALMERSADRYLEAEGMRLERMKLPEDVQAFPLDAFMRDSEQAFFEMLACADLLLKADAAHMGACLAWETTRPVEKRGQLAG